MPSPSIAVIGLGYVGLPLAIAFARRFSVTGYDLDPARVRELGRGIDRCRAVDGATLAGTALELTCDPADMAGADIYVIAVPTPVDSANAPDLGFVRTACRTVGAGLAEGAIVVLESTVYPGVTEGLCGPELEAASGLACGVDFFLGYSPERINPGDDDHAVDRITKVVAGQTPEVAQRLKEIYGAITSGGVFVARDIRTAEAAKVIENAQRDINIAFMNEIAQIFGASGLSMHDVLAAATTKWNFLRFAPGLVGGHCIGVDPYYLAHHAKEVGHAPEVILAGRRINDGMGAYVARSVARALEAGPPWPGRKKVLVLGLTFKENVPDLRNTKVVDVVEGLAARGCDVHVHDPLVDAGEAERLYGLRPVPDLAGQSGYDCVVGAVAHESYRAFTAETFRRLLKPGGLVADVKGMWRDVALGGALRRWEL